MVLTTGRSMVYNAAGAALVADVFWAKDCHSIFMERKPTMEKVNYLYALDVKNWVIVAALSFPDEYTAQKAFRTASQDLEGYGASGQFEYGIACVGADAWIKHKLPNERGWFDRFRGYHEEGKLYKEGRFERYEFESAEIQTNAAVFQAKHYKAKDCEHYVLFMLFAALALEESAQKKPSIALASVPKNALPELSSDNSYQAQVMSDSGLFASAVAASQESMECADASVQAFIMNVFMLFTALALLQKIVDFADLVAIGQ